MNPKKLLVSEICTVATIQAFVAADCVASATRFAAVYTVPKCWHQVMKNACRLL